MSDQHLHESIAVLEQKVSQGLADRDAVYDLAGAYREADRPGAAAELLEGYLRESGPDWEACRLCVDGCVRGCVKMDADDEIALLCDLCGGEPQCVKHCPEDAIAYVPFEHADRGFREYRALQLVGTKGGAQ